MPLYQNKGREGFFIIKRIKPFFLKLSVLLRRFKADNFFVLFPGVSWENRKKKVLIVNLKTAKFMVKPLFHLLGYRNKQVNKTHLKLYNRERVAKDEMYKSEPWYKKTT
jgi:succinylglutamate desuccinylase